MFDVLNAVWEGAKHEPYGFGMVCMMAVAALAQAAPAVPSVRRTN